MSRILYVAKKFSPGSMAVIREANAICAEYSSQGYDLTLRQLYYQFVSRDLIANKQSEYKRLGSIINDARLAGLLDWDYIVDRTRNVEIPASWKDPASIVDAAANSYHIDRWKDLPYRVEVWVEKEALAGVVERATEEWRVPWFSCRGYTSQSELWGAAQRLRGYLVEGQMPVVIHLGDHDPSGIDMTRDIFARLKLFMTQDWFNEQWDKDDAETVKKSDIRKHMWEWVKHRDLADGRLGFDVYDDEMPVIVNRIALNMDQVHAYNPPPNPAKFTDSRARDYVERYGHESWELDALEPRVLDSLIQDTIEGYCDMDGYNVWLRRERAERARLREVAEAFRSSEGDEEE